MNSHSEFLESGLLNAGVKKRLLGAWPNNLSEILDESPDDLLNVPGIGPKRKDQILHFWNLFKVKQTFTNFLKEEGLPDSWGKVLWDAYGHEALRVLKEKPYQTCKDCGLAFDDMDPFALQMGFSKDFPGRTRAALYDFLKIQYRQGHCAYPEDVTIHSVLEKLGTPKENLEETLELETVSGDLIIDLIRDTPCLYLRKTWELEQQVAHDLMKFQDRTSPCGWINFPKAMNWAERLLGFPLAPLQKKAIETSLSFPLTLITGGPGTGKTTLVRSLITILKTQFVRFALCSPTGRGAQRLGEATGAFAQTIHRLLKYDGTKETFAFNENHCLDLDFVLVDEASMIDLELTAHLLKALPSHCALVLVGDVDQIPSVGPGNVFQSILSSGRFHSVELQSIFRQSEKSLIKINAGRVKNGLMPLYGQHGDFHYFPVRNAQEAREKILQIMQETFPEEYGLKDWEQIQVLTPLHKGTLGTEELNKALQGSLNKNNLYLSGESPFFINDKVMVVKNDYKREIFNGDIGFVESIDPLEKIIRVRFGTRQLAYHFDEHECLTLAYAITVHKSQGSEYRGVIVVLSREHLPMAQRHLIYTAITRGKEHVALVAEPDALKEAIDCDENGNRWQRLSQLLEA